MLYFFPLNPFPLLVMLLFTVSYPAAAFLSDPRCSDADSATTAAVEVAAGLGGALFAGVFLAGAFFTGTFFAGAILAGAVFFAGAAFFAGAVFFTGAFFAGAAFLTGAFFVFATRPVATLFAAGFLAAGLEEVDVDVDLELFLVAGCGAAP